MGALLFAAAHVVLHPIAAKVAVTVVKVASAISGGMLIDHIVFGD